MNGQISAMQVYVTVSGGQKETAALREERAAVFSDAPILKGGAERCIFVQCGVIGEARLCRIAPFHGRWEDRRMEFEFWS